MITTRHFTGIRDRVDHEAKGIALQDVVPGNESVHGIGTMTIEFESYESGVVTFSTSHEEVGSGSFVITRLLEVMNTHCTGGISDVMHADAMFGEQRIIRFSSPAEDGRMRIPLGIVAGHVARLQIGPAQPE